LHPTKKVTQAEQVASSLYQGDPQGVWRHDAGGDTFSAWQDVPVSPSPSFTNAHTKSWIFYDNNDIDTTNIWNQVKNNNGTTPALIDGKAGGVVFTVGDTEGQSYNYIESKSKIARIEQGKSLWVEFEVKIEDLSGLGVMGFQVGFSTGISFGEGIISTSHDYAVIVDVLLDNANLETYLEGDGDVDYLDIVGADFEVSDGDFHKVGVHVAPNADDKTKFDMFIFKGDDLALTYTEVELPTDQNMGVIVGSYSHEDRLTLRSIKLVQEE
jgi:hypothetical protein